MDTKELQQKIKKLSAVANKNRSFPILQNYHFQRVANAFLISSYDLDSCAQVGIQDDNIDPSMPDSFLLPASATKLLSKLKGIDTKLSFEHTDGVPKITIESGRLKTTLNTVDVSEYPEFPTPEDAGIAYQPDIELGSLSNLTKYCSDNEARIALNGVYFDGPKGRLVATDGHRMGVRNFDAGSSDSQFIIPLASIKIANKLFKKGSTLQLQTFTQKDVHHFVLKSDDGMRLTTRSTGAEYPKYEQVLPENLSNYLVIDSHKFVADIETVTALADDRFSSVKLAINGGIKLSHSHIELGETELQVTDGSACAGNKYEPAEIGFNAKYLVDSFKSAEKGELVEMYYRDHSTGSKIVFENGDFDIVMPLRQ